MSGCTVRKRNPRGTNIAKTPEYGTWKGMRHRCSNTKHRLFKYYGGRGIRVCQRWHESFLAFLEDMGPRPSPRHSIERVDNDGNYEPGNCIWADKKTQLRNTRQNRMLTFRGETRCMAEWAEKLGIDRGLIDSRLKNGWSVEDALTVPKIENRYSNLQGTVYGTR